MKIPVYLITGFLGSGKTTLLQHIIDSTPVDEKIAIIQNEFAPANIDGKELKRNTGKDFDLLEINNGSVFCVCLLSDFITSLNKFIDIYHLHILYIEASGLSDPVSVAQIFESKLIRNKLFYAGSVCVVDAVNFLKLSKLQQRIGHQLLIADKVIVNKTDIDGFKKDEITEKIKSTNPIADIYYSSYCDVPLNKIFDSNNNMNAKVIPEELSKLQPLGRPEINTAVLRTVKVMQFLKIDSFIKNISPGLIRLKGYIIADDRNLYSVQLSFDNYQVEKISSSNNKQTELIAIGDKIDAHTLSHIYKSFCQ